MNPSSDDLAADIASVLVKFLVVLPLALVVLTESEALAQTREACLEHFGADAVASVNGCVALFGSDGGRGEWQVDDAEIDPFTDVRSQSAFRMGNSFRVSSNQDAMILQYSCQAGESSLTVGVVRFARGQTADARDGEPSRLIRRRFAEARIDYRFDATPAGQAEWIITPDDLLMWRGAGVTAFVERMKWHQVLLLRVTVEGDDGRHQVTERFNLAGTSAMLLELGC